MPKVSEQELSSDNLEFSWPPQSRTGAFPLMTECGDAVQYEVLFPNLSYFVHYKVFLIHRILTCNKTNLLTS